MDVLKTVNVIEVLENYLELRRPPEPFRKEVDLAYKIEKQSVIIFELRPFWDRPDKMIESNIAKATFVASKKHWKVFWQRADLEWHSYSPCPTVTSISDFIDLIEEDKHGCFWG